jgi:predicted HTH transcriptional regulator
LPGKTVLKYLNLIEKIGSGDKIISPIRSLSVLQNLNYNDTITSDEFIALSKFPNNQKYFSVLIGKSGQQTYKKIFPYDEIIKLPIGNTITNAQYNSINEKYYKFFRPNII